jgi:hypothetical protein
MWEGRAAEISERHGPLRWEQFDCAPRGENNLRNSGVQRVALAGFNENREAGRLHASHRWRPSVGLDFRLQ